MDRAQRHRELFPGLQLVLEQAARDPAVPGVMAAIHWRRHGFRWTAAAGGGLAGRGDGPPPDCSNSFRIASVSKLFVAAAMMRLVESARVDLTSPLDCWIGEQTLSLLNAAGYDAQRITLDMLMTHTSGLPDHVQVGSYGEKVVAHPAHGWTRAEQVELAVRAGPPLASPGEYFSYSDTGYVLLGEAIERITGQSIAAAVRGLLDFGRLGLEHTFWERLEPEPADASRRTRQWMGDVDATDFDPSFDLHGGGGLVSTVVDLGRFADALFCGRVFDSPSTLSTGLLVPPARREPGAYVHSRLAMVLPLGSRLGWGHLGYWGCATAHCPELGLSVAASINQSRPERDGLLLAMIGQLVDLTQAHFIQG